MRKASHVLRYELWDVATGNRVGRYSSEIDAMARVRSLLARFRAKYANDVELIEEDDFGNLFGSATGANLIARAESASRAG